MVATKKKKTRDSAFERRRESFRQSLREAGKLKATYSTAELAEILNCSTDQVLRIAAGAELGSMQRRRATGSPHLFLLDAVLDYGAEKSK